MSVDLDWLQLSVLSTRLLETINHQLETAERPSFIGPITVSSFEFGEEAPDIELIDVRDIYRDFLDEEVEEERVSEHPRRSKDGHDGYEWVSRGHTKLIVPDSGLVYHPLPPHIRYGAGSSASLSVEPQKLHGYDINIGRRPLPDHYSNPNLSSSSSSLEPPARLVTRTSTSGNLSTVTEPIQDKSHSTESISADVKSSDPTPAAPTPENDLQLHFRVAFHSDLKVAISTSLILNHPAPLFMALPIKLVIIGFEFFGELVVANEASKNRAHVCILDHLDPYAPASAGKSSADSLYGERDREKIAPVGNRLLPNIYIESEIGQTDKHVLRNVSRVEKFIQDLIRSTLVDELVFPNFHTVVYGDV